ncbi:radical SAM protein [Candidatus Pacearchaeota archaeon]|nr:radical SAM protein [Candidatus Pacearchaeota archaeon]
MDKYTTALVGKKQLNGRYHSKGDGDKLTSLRIEIPTFCHLDCKYCFSKDIEKGCQECSSKPSPLSTEQYLKVIDDFADIGGKMLGIPGNGEPFHPKNREFVLQVLDHAKSRGLYTVLFTTADLIFWGTDTERCLNQEPDFTLMDKLVDYDITLNVMYNSGKPEVQDKLARRKGFTKLRGKAIDLLIKRYKMNEKPGPEDDETGRLGLVTMIIPENKDEILEIAKFARDRKLIFKCNTVLPRGRGGSDLADQQDCVTPEEYKAIYKKLEEKSEKELSLCGYYVGMACKRSKGHMYVDIKGDVYPCIGCIGVENCCDSEIGGLILGNVCQKSLAKIWDSSLRKLSSGKFEGVIFGPCSNCYNFHEDKCSSCFGRCVERFEVDKERLIVLTKGCFNHRPRWRAWERHCRNSVINIVSNIPKNEKTLFKTDIARLGMETFWKYDCTETGQKEGGQYPYVRKDLSYSKIDFHLADAWKIVPATADSIVEWIANEKFENKIDFQRRYEQKYQGAIGTLLPRLLLTSLKLLFDEYGRDKDEDRDTKRFLPKVDGLSKSDKGLIQFANLMFFLPDKRKYVYRTITNNSLDTFILDLPEYKQFTTENTEASDKISRAIRIKNRQYRFMLRWGENFRKNEDAVILPHIKNLSRDLDEEKIETYELVLSEQLFETNKFEIDCEIRFRNNMVLSIFPLLDLDLIQSMIFKLHHRLSALAADDEKWERLCGRMSTCAFLSDAQDQSELESFYVDLAQNVLYQQDSYISQAHKQQLLTALMKITAINTISFSEGAGLSWSNDSLDNVADKFSWGDFHGLLGNGDFFQRKYNELKKKVLACFDLPETSRGDDIIVKRLYNPLLLQIINHFVDSKGELQCEWYRAVNYFIWLGFHREHLNIRSYFVHHPPNLRRFFEAIMDKSDAEKRGNHSTPCGIIIGSHGRLPVSAKDDIIGIFGNIMEPLEELIQAEDVIRRHKNHLSENILANRLAEERKIALSHYGHTLKHRLDTLNAFLDKHGTKAIQTHTQMLRDLTMILQLNAVDNEYQLLNRLPDNKKKRFLDLQTDSKVAENINLSDKILNDWANLVSAPLTLAFEERPGEDKSPLYEEKCWCQLDIKMDDEFYLGFIESADGVKYRLKEGVYRELIFELLINIRRYGYCSQQKGYCHDDLKVISKPCRIFLEEHELKGFDSKSPLLVLRNRVQKTKVSGFPNDLRSRVWEKWPESKRYDGPGMAASLLRRLGIGEMYFKTSNSKKGNLFFYVGLYLKGLERSHHD